MMTPEQIRCGRCGDELDPARAIKLGNMWACSENCAHDIEQQHYEHERIVQQEGWYA